MCKCKEGIFVNEEVFDQEFDLEKITKMIVDKAKQDIKTKKKNWHHQ